MDYEHNQHQLAESTEQLAKVVDKLDRDFTARRSWWYSFSHGVLQGIGLVLGATVFFVIVFYALVALEGVPVIGNWSSRIIDQFYINREVFK